MTIAQVIEKSGIGKSQILRLLNNQRAIDMNDLALISHALDVEPNDIMGRAQARLNREDA
jgi:transcriptional regulator with XRE-family HTH domain